MSNRLMRSGCGIVLHLALVLCGSRVALAQATFDVLAYGADPTGVADSAPAFRSALAAAVANNGGIVVIPTGTYKFTSTDPADSESHVLVQNCNIVFDGDAPGATGSPTATGGSMISSSTTNKIMFKLAHTASSGSVKTVIFQDLKFTRQSGVIATYPGSAIAFDDLRNDGVIASLGDVRISNCHITAQYDGIQSIRRSATQAGQADLLLISQCHVLGQQRHGMYLRDFNELKINQSHFRINNYTGIFLECNRLYQGTATMTGVTCYGNASTGISLIGTSTTPIQDIHISASQVDSNLLDGVAVSYGNNIAIAASSISANGDSSSNSGLYVSNSVAVSVAGTNFVGNFGYGAAILNSSGVALTGCSFDWNNNDNGSTYALLLSGGQTISCSGLNFIGGPGSGGDQKYGIWLTNSPKQVVMTGVSFENGMLDYVGRFNIGSSTGIIEYLNPATNVYVRQVLPF